MKKSGNSLPLPDTSSNPSLTYNPAKKAKKQTSSSSSTSFRDSEYYIDLNSNFDERQSGMEAALQPSFGTGKDSKSSAMAMENAMLDMVGDENSSMVSKTRIMRWDKQKVSGVESGEWRVESGVEWSGVE